MIGLYRDPQCKSVTVAMKPKDIPGTTNSDTTFDGFMNYNVFEAMQKKITELETHIQVQQRQLDMYAHRDASPELQEKTSSDRLGSN